MPPALRGRGFQGSSDSGILYNVMATADVTHFTETESNTDS